MDTRSCNAARGHGGRGRRVLAGMAVLGVALSVVAAWQGSAAAEGAQADSAEYRKLIEDGLQEFDRRNWEEATALFKQAHALNPNARTLRALGLCAFEARHYAEALRYLKAALQDTRRPLTAKQRAGVERSIERAEHYVGGLTLLLDPPDASVRIDGQEVTVDPHSELVVDAGELEVEVSAPNYLTELRRVRVASEGHEEISVRLEPGDATAEATARATPAVAGSAAHSPPSDRGDHGGALGTWKWVASAAALAGLAVGVTALVLGNSDANRWNACRDASQPSCLGSHDRSQTEKTISTVGFATGAGLGVLGVVLFVLDAKQTSSVRSALRCGPGRPDLGVACRLAF